MMEFYPHLHILRGVDFLRRNPEFIVDAVDWNVWYDVRCCGTIPPTP